QLRIVYLVYRCVKKNGPPAVNINTSFASAAAMYTVAPDSQRDTTVEKFLKEIASEKPIRFTRRTWPASPTTTRLGSAPVASAHVQWNAPQWSHGRYEAPPPRRQ
uniref:Uncharacterized protein n=1 Tax=Oryza brachyantha TaxID=4533 RepID=J3MI63_ORYBR